MSLTNIGYTIIVLAPLDEGALREENWNGLKIFRFPYFYPHRWMRLAYGSGMPDNIRKNVLLLFQVPFFFMMEFFYTFWIVKKERISIVNAQRLIPQGVVTSLIQLLFPVKTIVTVHGSDIRLPPAFITNFFLRRAHTIVSPHPELTALINTLGTYPVYEIPNITDEKKFTPDLPEEQLREELSIHSKHVVTFIARLNDFKDPVTFIKSIPLVIKTEPDIVFLIAGDGPLENALMNLIRELKIEKYVRLLGTRNDVDRILKISTIFTALSPYENIWSLVIIEAMKTGIPCIVTNTGTTADHLKDGQDAILIPPHDENSLAREIVRLLHDEKKRQCLSKNSLDLMESQFSVASIEEKYRCLISTLSQK